MKKWKLLGAGAVLGTVGAVTVPAEAEPLCQPTDIGLSAHYVNELPTEPLEVRCDIGVYFGLHRGSIQPGLVDGVTITGTTAGARTQQWGIYVAGGSVDVINSSVTVEEGYPHEFFSVTYVGHIDVAEGSVANNVLTGGHRTAVVLGPGARADVADNTVRGVGPRSRGWPQRGIAVGSGAAARVAGNTVSDHWWDTDDAVSPGISVAGQHAVVEENEVRDNDVGLIVDGDSNTIRNNVLAVTYEAVNIAELYGVVVDGDGNSITGNTITSDTGTGIGLSVGGGLNEIDDNDIRGWGQDVVIRP